MCYEGCFFDQVFFFFPPLPVTLIIWWKVTHPTHTHTHIVIKACFCMHNQFCLAMKFCFISLNMLTLRITAVVNRKSCVNTWSATTWCEGWCAVSATAIITFFLRPHIHTNILGRLWHHILDMCPITREAVLSQEEESATPNTANNSIYCSENVFIHRIISMKM